MYINAYTYTCIYIYTCIYMYMYMVCLSKSDCTLDVVHAGKALLHCNTLQHIATHCNTLQHAHSNALPHASRMFSLSQSWGGND